jgi:Molybdopterin oxidoreductase N-terminal domain
MVLTSTHWGTYEVTAKEGRIDNVRPFKLDPDPSPIGYSLRDALTHPTRVLRPMVRKGWLDNDCRRCFGPQPRSCAEKMFTPGPTRLITVRRNVRI